MHQVPVYSLLFVPGPDELHVADPLYRRFLTEDVVHLLNKSGFCAPDTYAIMKQYSFESQWTIHTFLICLEEKTYPGCVKLYFYKLHAMTNLLHSLPHAKNSITISLSIMPPMATPSGSLKNPDRMLLGYILGYFMSP